MTQRSQNFWDRIDQENISKTRTVEIGNDCYCNCHWRKKGNTHDGQWREMRPLMSEGAVELVLLENTWKLTEILGKGKALARLSGIWRGDTKKIQNRLNKTQDFYIKYLKPTWVYMMYWVYCIVLSILYIEYMMYWVLNVSPNSQLPKSRKKSCAQWCGKHSDSCSSFAEFLVCVPPFQKSTYTNKKLHTNLKSPTMEQVYQIFEKQQSHWRGWNYCGTVEICRG